MMTKIRSYILILSTLFCLTSFVGCRKAPMNGNLDGQWEVVEVIPAPEKIVIDRRLFFNFQLHVCQLTYYEGFFQDANMIYDGSTLWLEFPFAESPSHLAGLQQYGIYSNPVIFNVEFPKKDQMILSNEESIVLLKKH